MSAPACSSATDGGALHGGFASRNARGVRVKLQIRQRN